MQKKIVLIGSGNVATHLGKALVRKGQSVSQVWSRERNHAEDLARQLQNSTPFPVEYIDQWEMLDRDADFYLICVLDQAISQVIQSLPLGLSGIVAHTSGSTDLTVFSHYSGAYGVFYPLQTFSKNKDLIDFKEIPLGLEASSSLVYQKLEGLGRTLSDNVFACNSEQRLALHVSAVFACNFTNHMYALAEDLLEKHHLDVDLIRPLIEETARKALQFSPKQVQTGPAKRGDYNILQKHQAFLAKTYPGDSKNREVYALISELIHRGFQPE